MSREETISWIFLATAMASEIEPASFSDISSIADGINHTVPSHRELQTSFSWLTNNALIVKQGKKYKLTDKGKFEFESASKKTDLVLEIWKNIERSFEDKYSGQ